MHSSLDLQPPYQLGHKWFPSSGGGPFGTLKLTNGPLNASIYFTAPDQIDGAIAELVALRAEMTADAEATAALSASIDAGTPVVVDEDEPERVPWPTGFCSHPVTPGAWSQGFTTCRDCLSDTTPDGVSWYDRATFGEQLDRAAS